MDGESCSELKKMLEILNRMQLDNFTVIQFGRTMILLAFWRN